MKPNDLLNLSRLEELRRKPVKLSKETAAAVAQLDQLYKAGKVFVKNDVAVRREADVYLAACKLADQLGQDLAKHLGRASSGYTDYTIIYNMRFRFQVRVGPGKCAVGTYDYKTRVCKYEGLVSC